MELKSILLIQLAGLGDMVMATPAIENFRRLYPQAKICLLTNARSADIVRGSPYIDKIFVLGGAGDIFATIRNLRSYRFDMVVNLYRLYSFKGALKMFLLFRAIGARYWAGRDTDGRGFFYHLKVPERLADKKHEVEYKLDIVRALGGQVKDIILRAEYDREDESFVDAALNSRGVAGNDVLVGINCGTYRPSHNWLPENYAKLADCIIEALKVKVGFIGIETDKNIFIKIERLMKNEPINFMGVFDVRQLVCFLKRCRLFISPDSGPVHIASALGVPMVVLFGPAEYERYRPYGNDGKSIIIRKEVECSPCSKYYCRNNRCMKLITPEEVFEAVKQLPGKPNA